MMHTRETLQNDALIPVTGGCIYVGCGRRYVGSARDSDAYVFKSVTHMFRTVVATIKRRREHLFISNVKINYLYKDLQTREKRINRVSCEYTLMFRRKD